MDPQPDLTVRESPDASAGTLERVEIQRSLSSVP